MGSACWYCGAPIADGSPYAPCILGPTCLDCAPTGAVRFGPTAAEEREVRYARRHYTGRDEDLDRGPQS